MIRGFLKRHPMLSGTGGAALGWSAASGNVWAILASLGIVGARMDEKASDAARAAAVQVGKTDPACVQDITSPECIDHAKRAAIAAGQQQRGTSMRMTMLIIAGIALAIIAAFNGIGHPAHGAEFPRCQMVTVTGTGAFTLDQVQRGTRRHFVAGGQDRCTLPRR
jgi:hypothetical protein